MDEATVRRQVLFRSVNERIAAIQDRLGDAAELELFCECGTDGCTTRVVVARDEFTAIVVGGGRVLAPEHGDSR